MRLDAMSTLDGIDCGENGICVEGRVGRMEALGDKRFRDPRRGATSRQADPHIPVFGDAQLEVERSYPIEQSAINGDARCAPGDDVASKNQLHHVARIRRGSTPEDPH
jgi:hypothetical protein